MRKEQIFKIFISRYFLNVFYVPPQRKKIYNKQWNVFYSFMVFLHISISFLQNNYKKIFLYISNIQYCFMWRGFFGSCPVLGSDTGTLAEVISCTASSQPLVITGFLICRRGKSFSLSKFHFMSLSGHEFRVAVKSKKLYSLIYLNFGITAVL